MNNINRENYETFFLLYTDNELSAAEKKLVEEFVEANPDLQEELVMLQQSILKPDAIAFDDKNSLFKNESIASSIQDKLLLLLDNELTDPDRFEINDLLLSSAEVQEEWKLIQQTKLQPETVVFDDKQSLYRKEAARVVAFPWKRIAAAAVLIGFGLWGGWSYLNHADKLNGEQVARKTPAVKPTVKPIITQDTAPQLPPVEQEVAVAVADIKKASSTPANNSSMPRKVINRTIVVKEELAPVAIQKKDNQLPKPYFENLNNPASNKTVADNVKPEKQPVNIVKPGNNVTDNNGPQDAANPYAAQTSFTEDSENNNRVFYIEEEKIKKTKLAGVFRKVKRVFERNTNLKSGGNNIKVANLEFAIQ